MNERLDNQEQKLLQRGTLTGEPEHGADQELEENEPYLGPAWAAVMLVLYLLKQAFPAEQFSVLWWFQIYVICLVIAITVFTLVKRHQFYRSERTRLRKQ